MKKLHFFIPIILLLSIIGSFVGIVYNLKFNHDKLQDISKTQLPLYEANQLVVDEEGNYYIGDGWYNLNIQIFDSKGNYKNTLSFSSGSCNFSVDKSTLTVICYTRSSQNMEYIIDLDKMKIIKENKISNKEAEDLSVMYDQFPEKKYKLGNTIYELKRNFLLYNKINIIENNIEIKTITLKNMPIFPLPMPVYLGSIVLLFWGLALYTHVVLYFDETKERLKKYFECLHIKKY